MKPNPVRTQPDPKQNAAWLILVLLLVGFAMVVSACGDDEPEPEQPRPATNTPTRVSTPTRPPTDTPTPAPATVPSPTPTPVTAIGGVDLFGTVLLPVSTIQQGIMVPLLCNNVVIPPGGEVWQVAPTIIQLVKSSSQLSIAEGDRNVLVVQRCTGEITPFLPIEGPVILDPSLVIPPRVEITPESALPDRTRLRPLQPYDPNILIRPDIAVLPTAVPPEYVPWQPPEAVLTITGPDGQVATLQPDVQFSTWRYFFPEDSPSGTYVVTVESRGEVTTLSVEVLPSERIIVRESSTSATATTLTSWFDASIELLDFQAGRPLDISLFRVIPAPVAESDLPPESLTFFNSGAPQILARVSAWSVEDAQAGSFFWIADTVPVDANAIVAGRYVLLACYRDSCAPAPQVDVNASNNSVLAIRWPELYYASFEVNPGLPVAWLGIDPDVRFEIVAPMPGLDGTPVRDALSIEAIAAAGSDLDSNGAGIAYVEFRIYDTTGVLVHEIQERTPAYCGFGGSAPCAEWDFAANRDRWPSGQRVQDGWHTMTVTVVTEDGRTFSREASFLIERE